jgi:protein O-GlcNAc transferase
LRLGDSARARGAFEAALRADNSLAAAHMNLGALDLHENDPAAAESAFRRALEISPGEAALWSQLGTALLNQGRADESIGAHAEALKLDPRHPLHRANLIYTLVMAPSASAKDLFEQISRWARDYDTLPPIGASIENLAPERRLRIGYVSGDLRDHPVSSFVEPLFANHDRSRFEVFCYFNHDKVDAQSARLKALVEGWRAVRHLNDESLAQLIRDDGIDVLIDLAGHTHGNRLPALARRPAPVQMTYLGFPASTGLRAIGCRITDAVLDPPGEGDAHYTEKQLRMRQSLWCYRPLEVFPDPGPAPHVSRGSITFGSLNGFHKVNAEVLDAWIELLRQIPQSRLVMVTVPEGMVRERLLEHFRASGIDESRITLHGRLPRARFREALRNCDIALDTFPCGGGATTCETLWMGVPVVTRTAATPVSRAGASLLQSIGLGELVAVDSRGYIDIAANLARSPQRIAQLREGLRGRMQHSPLMQEGAFTRAFEECLREAWREHCQASK